MDDTQWETVQNIIDTNLGATIDLCKIFDRINFQPTTRRLRHKIPGNRQLELDPDVGALNQVSADLKHNKSHARDGDIGISPCIINISSLLGVKGGVAVAAYAASKAAVLGFTRALACEHGRFDWARNIRVNAIVPGYIDTPMTQSESEHLSCFLHQPC